MKYKYIVALGGLNHFDIFTYRFTSMSKEEAIEALTAVLTEEHHEHYAHEPTVDDLIIQSIFGSETPISELL